MLCRAKLLEGGRSGCARKWLPVQVRLPLTQLPNLETQLNNTTRTVHWSTRSLLQVFDRVPYCVFFSTSLLVIHLDHTGHFALFYTIMVMPGLRCYGSPYSLDATADLTCDCLGTSLRFQPEKFYQPVCTALLLCFPSIIHSSQESMPLL